jgi:hypothetical protein
MSHHVPYYAQAPLGQAPPAPVTTPAVVDSSAMVVYSPAMTLWRLISMATSVALAYHGYRRNHGSILWAFVWAGAGGIVAPIGLGLAFAQGFGKPAPLRQNRSRRSRRRSR